MDSTEAVLVNGVLPVHRGDCAKDFAMANPDFPQPGQLFQFPDEPKWDVSYDHIQFSAGEAENLAISVSNRIPDIGFYRLPPRTFGFSWRKRVVFEFTIWR